MNELTNFNPEQSAEKVKTLWSQRQTLSLEIVKELYLAKEFYSGKGSNQYTKKGNELIIGTYNQLITFKDYLEYIGLYQGKVYQWFDRYIPQENKLLSWKEYEEIKQIEYRHKVSEEQKKKEIVNKYYETGKKPKDWKIDYQKDYDKKVQEEKDRDQRIKETDIKLEEAKKKVQEINEKIDADYKIDTSILDDLLKENQEKREFKAKHLSKVTDLNSFYDVIDTYINSLQDNNRQLEALNSIIKYCRDKANKLHRS